MSNAEALELVQDAMMAEGKPQKHKVALMVAMDALEKQIPKRPIMKPYEIGICPSCGAEDGGCSENWHRPFCCSCGQALLWDE